MTAGGPGERGDVVSKPVRRAVGSLLWLCAALAGCETESSTTFNYPNPLCLDVTWAGLGSEAGVTPPTLDCASTLQCPPPLTCQKRGQQSTGECVMLRDVVDPSAPAAVYGLPEFLLSVEEGDDYNLLSFNGLPPDAAVLRCNFYICPVDADVLREAPARCRYASEVVNLGLTGSLALGVLANGPDNLSVEGNVLACGVEDAAGVRGESLRFQLAAVGFYAVCYAFNDTALVAVSAVSGLSRAEVGRAGQDAYQTDCSAPEAVEGAACTRTTISGADDLGVCVGATCCAPCWNDRDCEPYGGSACLTVQPLVAPESGELGRPISGFCPDVVCSDRRGTLQCAVPAPVSAADAGVEPADGMQETTSAWIARDTQAGCPAAFLDDGGVADGGVGDVGPPDGDAGVGQMGPPDSQPSDSEPSDSQPSDSQPPDSERIDAQRPPRMP